MRTSFRTITLPVQPNNPAFVGEVEDIFTKVSAPYLKKLKGYASIGLVLQPFPHNFGKASEERGGNAMGLSGKDHDRYVIEIPGIYSNKADDEVMQAWGREFTEKVTEHLKATAVSGNERSGYVLIHC